MFSWLNLRMKGGNLYVSRKGPIWAFKVNVDKEIVIAYPPEVLANNDRLIVEAEIEGDYTLSDQAFTKVASDSNVTIKYSTSCNGSLKFIPHPVLVYNRGNLNMEIDIRTTGDLNVLEVFRLGRRGSGEVYNNGLVTSLFRIFYRDELVVYDVFRVRDSSWMDDNIMGHRGLATCYTLKDGQISTRRELIENFQEVSYCN